ncbi:hypothetical protein [Chitinophaga nivalis]|uniref:Uncharacterized protein n=1 Tax=Chitinophaga nivalis TaxID=2991709 RepID=A0ABT3IFS8_9BACT|nr:hypothetical protein [Chitinophaga nivalis]MCW3467505.1 hypothetical protein [Chitinophaga nivalis]MCW3482803.1 hypothetical protein [Chitinophaga nivalis]
MKQWMLLPVLLVITITRLYGQEAPAPAADMRDSIRGLKSCSVAGFGNKNNTVGSPYLYTSWEYMWLDSMNNKPVQRARAFHANLDLEKNMLIIKGQNGHTYTPEVAGIQAFHFKHRELSYYYVGVETNRQWKFMQQLVKGKYMLVKDTHIILVKADIEDNEPVPGGKEYDEYKKEYSYYLIAAGTPVKVSIRKKLFLSALENDPVALEASRKFFSLYDGPFDENAAVALIAFINKQ